MIQFFCSTYQLYLVLLVWPQIRHAENDELVLLLLNQVDLALSSNLESHANDVDDDDINNINDDVDNDDDDDDDDVYDDDDDNDNNDVNNINDDNTSDANDENLDSLLCPNPRLDPDWPSNF